MWTVNFDRNISKGVKSLINQSKLRTYTKVNLFKKKSSFRLKKILNVMTKLKLGIGGQYIRITMSHNLVAFSCILILYGCLDAWPINTEIPGITLLFLE